MSKSKCKLCGMIRSDKDLILQKDGKYVCFSCWNKILKEKSVQN